MQFGGRENPGRYDKLDYDNDNDNDHDNDHDNISQPFHSSPGQYPG